MILNVDIIYAEFLENFLNIIRDEQAKNTAILYSGFLRSGLINTSLAKLSNDHSYIPLSSITKAGLVDDKGCILNNSQAKRIGLYVDLIRAQATLKQLGIDISKFNEVQQLTLATSCQEAINRTTLGSFRPFIENAGTISSLEQQEKVFGVFYKMHIVTLGKIVEKLAFNANSTDLTKECIALISKQRAVFIEMAEANPGIDIPNEDLQTRVEAPITSVSPTVRIAILDDLVPALAVDLGALSLKERLEHDAKLQLLKLHSTILSMTLKDSWQVKTQWLKIGNQVQIGDDRITLPHSISIMLDLIVETSTQTPKANYLLALGKIQQVARDYQNDWYKWARNQLPLISSAPAVKELLNSVLAINLDVPGDEIEAGEEFSVVNTITSSIVGAVQYGLSFFMTMEAAEPEPAEKNIKKTVGSSSPM